MGELRHARLRVARLGIGRRYRDARRGKSASKQEKRKNMNTSQTRVGRPVGFSMRDRMRELRCERLAELAIVMPLYEEACARLRGLMRAAECIRELDGFGSAYLAQEHGDVTRLWEEILTAEGEIWRLGYRVRSLRHGAGLGFRGWVDPAPCLRNYECEAA